MKKGKILYIGAILRKNWRGGEPVGARNAMKFLEKLGYNVKQSNYEPKYVRFVSKFIEIYRKYIGISDAEFFASRFYFKQIQTENPDIIISQYDFDTSIVKAAIKANKNIIVYSHIWWPICPKLTLLKWNKERCQGFRGNDCITCIRLTKNTKTNRYLQNIFKFILEIKSTQRKMERRVNNLNSRNVMIIVPSSQMRDYFIGNGVNEKKIRIIPNGIAPTDFVYNLKEKDKIVTYLGGESEVKGYSIFLEVARRIKDLIPEVKFYATGTCENKAKYINYTDQVNSSSVKKLLTKSRCTVFPAIWDEPFSIAWLESMASGTPVITFNTGSASDVIDNGKNGFVIKTFDIEEMVQRVIQLVSDEQLLLTMSKNARKTAVNKFNETKRINMISDLVLELSTLNQNRKC